jgi:integrase
VFEGKGNMNLTTPPTVGKINPISMEEGWDMKGGWFVPKGRRYPRVWYPWKGKKLFFNRYLNGERIYHPEQAERLLSRIRSEVDAKTFNPADWGKDHALLVKHAWQTYQDQAPCGTGRHGARQTMFDRYLSPYFGEKSLTEIEEEHIKEWYSQLPKTLAPGTIGQILATLKAFFNSCRVTRRKVFKYPKTTLPRKQIVWLTRMEQDRILTVLPAQHQGIIRFLMLYGCRVSEACNLRRSDIDWGKREITLRERKSGEDNTLPIMEEIEEYLVGEGESLEGSKYIRSGTEKARVGPSQMINACSPTNVTSLFVFSHNSIPYTRRIVGYLWGVALKKAGIKHLPLKNGTRHSRAMQLMEDDVSTAAIARVLGNTEGIVRKAYARATTKMVANVLELRKAGGE